VKFRKLACPHCDYEGKPIKGTAGRVKRKGMTFICPSCRGPVE
jgi:hypothetical protein